MNSILFVDTSFNECRVMIVKNNELSEVYEDARKLRHSEKLLKLIDSALAEMKTRITDFDFFSAPQGPGSFTGIRIGLETAKGFAYALEKKMILLNNLDILMNSVNSISLNFQEIIAMIHSGNNMFYYSIYKRKNDALENIVANKHKDIREILKVLDGKSQYAVVCGAGSEIVFPYINEKNCCLFPVEKSYYRKAVGDMLKKSILCGNTIEPLKALPVYIKLTDAEVKKSLY